MVNNIVILCAWVSQIAYALCFLPQIVTNYRVKSGNAMSELFLVGYLNLHAATLFYVFLLNLPLAYKMCVPMQLALVLALVIQRLWYASASEAKQLGVVYLANLAGLVALIPYGSNNPVSFGNIAGWGTVTLGFLSQAPQAIKIWRERSVAGFDKIFVYVLLFAGAIEFCGAVIGGLPLQTKLSSSRVVSFSLIFLWQFKQFFKRHAR